MGFAVCVVSDLIRTPFLLELQWRELLQKIPGFPVQFTLIDKEMNRFCYVFTMAFVGAENNIDSEHTCLGYLPFDNILDALAFTRRRNGSLLHLWPNSLRSPNDWTCI